jgi:hypothetical protein
MTRRILSLIFSICVFICGNHAYSASPIYTLYTGANWMNRISDSTLLTKILIPGTHDSGAVEDIFPGTTQYDNIADQLANGVRFLDIRIQAVETFNSNEGRYLCSYRVVHGDLAWPAYRDFGDYKEIALQPITDFLKNHARETVYVSFKKERDTKIVNSTYETGPSGNCLGNFFKFNDNIYYTTANKQTTLGEVRGKIVVFNREGGENGKVGTKWGDPDIVNIQDDFNLSLSWFGVDYEAKWNAIKNKIDEAKDAPSNGRKYFANFLSANFLSAKIKPNAEYQNSTLFRYLKSAEMRYRAAKEEVLPMGSLFIMDYANNPLCLRKDNYATTSQDICTNPFADEYFTKQILTNEIIKANMRRVANRISIDDPGPILQSVQFATSDAVAGINGSTFDISNPINQSKSYIRFISAVGDHGSQLCLSVRGVDSHAAGTEAEAYYCHPNGEYAVSDHYWSTVDRGDDFVSLINQTSGLCLGVNGSDAHTVSSRVGVFVCDGSLNQQWQMRHDDQGYVQLVNRASTLCLGVINTDANNAGDAAEISTCQASPSDPAMDTRWMISGTGYKDFSDLYYAFVQAGWHIDRGLGGQSEQVIRDYIRTNNAVRTELMNRSTDRNLDNKRDIELVGHIHVYRWLLENNILSADALKQLSLDGQRNYVITLLQGSLKLPPSRIQSLDNIGLIEMASQVTQSRFDLKALCRAQNWHTDAELASYSADQVRNSVASHLSTRIAEPLATLQSLSDVDLAAAGWKFHWLLEKQVSVAETLSQANLASIRQLVQNEISRYQTTTPGELDWLSPKQLISRAYSIQLSPVHSFLLAAKHKTAAELRQMSKDDMSNVLRSELSQRSSTSIAELQSIPSDEIVSLAKINRSLFENKVRPASELTSLPLKQDSIVLKTPLVLEKCLDAFGGSFDNGTPIIIWDCHYRDNQQWIMRPSGEITSATHPDKCLDVEGGSFYDGTRVILWDCHGGPNQKWRLTENGLLKTEQEKCLDIYGAQTGNETGVIIWQCHGQANQRWIPEDRYPSQHHLAMQGVHIRDLSNGAIYLIDRGVLRQIPNAAVNSALFQEILEYRDVDNVKNFILGAPFSSDTYLAREGNDGAIYLVEPQQRRPIASTAAMDWYRFNSGKIKIVSTDSLNAIPVGEAIR